MPYIGYWQLINAVDEYIIFDDVNFIKRGWINRNNILLNGQAHMFSISLKESSQNKLINEIEIADDFKKLFKTMEMAYKNAPYKNEILDILNNLFFSNEKNLADFLTNSIITVLEYLDIHKIFKSSKLNNNKQLHTQDKILDICKICHATEYINAIGGQDLYDKEKFKNNNIDLYFLQPNITPYKQFKNDFIGSLSIIDVLMFNSSIEIKEMLNNFKLI